MHQKSIGKQAQKIRTHHLFFVNQTGLKILFLNVNSIFLVFFTSIFQTWLMASDPPDPTMLNTIVWWVDKIQRKVVMKKTQRETRRRKVFCLFSKKLLHGRNVAGYLNLHCFHKILQNWNRQKEGFSFVSLTQHKRKKTNLIQPFSIWSVRCIANNPRYVPCIWTTKAYFSWAQMRKILSDVIRIASYACALTGSQADSGKPYARNQDRGAAPLCGRVRG